MANVKRICLNCGNEFETKRLSDPDKMVKCCCRKCADTLRIKPSIKVCCEWCGKEFETKRKQARFCSSSCAGKWSSKNFPHGDAVSAHWKSLSEDEKLAISKKHSESMLNRTKEQEQERIQKMLETRSNWSDEKKHELSEKLSSKAKTFDLSHLRNLSEEQKQLAAENRWKTIRSKPGCEESRKSKISDTLRSKSSEEKLLIEQKKAKTKTENKTWNISKPEDKAYNMLCDVYGENDVLRQYRDDRYPYNCDFYILSQDLFIECNFTWTHGGMPFNENDQACLDILEEWCEKAQTSTFYKNAIEVWTRRDVDKLNCANINKLNFLSVYSLTDIETYLKERRI